MGGGQNASHAHVGVLVVGFVVVGRRVGVAEVGCLGRRVGEVDGDRDGVADGDDAEGDLDGDHVD